MTEQNTENTLDSNEQIQQRRDKLEQLRADGQAYPNGYVRDHISSDILATYGEQEKEALAEQNVEVVIADRQSSSVGDDSILAGQVGIARGVHVGNRVIIASKSGVPGTVRDGEVIAGYPAGSHRLWRRAVAGFWRLPEILSRLRAIERTLGIDRKSDAR